MKKVCHIISGLNDGGAEGVLYRLLINEKKYEHSVISLGGMGKYGELIKAEGIPLHCADMALRNHAYNILNLWKAYVFLKDVDPDVVQTWMYHGDLIGGILAKICGVSRIYWNVRHSDLRFNHAKVSTIMIAKLCAVLSRWLPTGIVYCAQSAKIVHERMGYHPLRSVVIPNGYDLTRFQPSPPLVDVTTARRFDGVLTIGMVARYNPQKNHDGLMQALSLVRDNNIPFRCILSGRGLDEKNAELKRVLSEYNLENQVELLGSCADVAAIMNSLDIHVLSSVSGEAFPNVVAEAMACGTPCIVTDVGDAAYIVEQTGWVVEANDVRALANAIVRAREEMAQSSVWLNRRKACVFRISNHFSIQTMLHAYVDYWSAPYA